MTTFTVDTTTYTIEQAGEGTLALTLERASIKHFEKLDIETLRSPLPIFVPQTATVGEEGIEIRYDVSGLRPFSDVLDLGLVERLRIAQRILVVQDLVGTPFTTVLHPENVWFSEDGQPRLLYRGISGEVPPVSFDPQRLLDQAKALISILVAGKGDFNNLYEGNGRLQSGRVSKINDAADFTALASVLHDQLVKEQEYQKKAFIPVTRRRYMTTLQIAIWSSVVAILGLVAIGFWQFSAQPFQNKVQDATTAFLKQDYTGVTKALDGVPVDSLPSAQRYELAYSYIQSASLSRAQSQAVLNNVSMNADTDYLNFWIENGRGDLTEALDTAKKTEDSDLILYSLTQQISAVKNNPNISGADREKKLTDLQKQYDTYNQKRTDALQGNDAKEQ